MAEHDALSSFDFSKVTNAGLFLKWQPGEPVTVRVLTTDPIVSQSEFTDKRTGEVVINTRFSFIVYNFTDKKAQIMRVTANTARRLGEIHTDPDFGANIKKIDLKITPPNKNEVRAYDIQVLPGTRSLTSEQIKEAQAIDLDSSVTDSKGRMSQYNQNMAGDPVGSSGSSVGKSGYDAAKAKRDELHAKNNPTPPDDEPAQEHLDDVVDDIGDEPINLDDIPF